MKNYELLFRDEYSKSQEIDETFARIKNEEGSSKAIEYLVNLGAKWLDTESYFTLCTINEFTKKHSEYNVDSLLKDIRGYEDVKSVTVEKDNIPKLLIEKEDYNLEVYPFSKAVPVALKELPDLENSNREGTCFEKAYIIGTRLGHPCQIVTGFVYGYCDKSKFLHSWVETNIKGHEVVIDGPLNAVINVEGYYQLRHVEVINKISDVQFRDDINNYLAHADVIPLEAYFACRDEIIADLSKNKNIFKK